MISGRRELIGLIAAASLARPARAQPKAVPVVGVLMSRSPGESALLVSAFLEGLGAAGYRDGHNVTVLFLWAEGHYDRLPALAADLVGRHVDVIVTGGGNDPVVAAKAATTVIPIVFETGADPVATRLVASLARPGGNLTGFGILVSELNPKRLELLSELVPQAQVIGALVNPANPTTERIVLDLQAAARSKGLQLPVLRAGTASEIDAAFASLAELRAGALVVANDPYFSSQRTQLVSLAARARLPAIYPFSEFATAGGLISYGPSLPAVYRLLGGYAGKILAGASPADLPVQQADTVEMLLNLGTAKALGLSIPPTILAGADEVIE